MKKQKNIFKFLVRKVKPMSPNGFNRLNKSARLNFKREVYEPIRKVVIDVGRVYDERTLAYLLMLKFGVGKYDGLAWNPSTHRLSKSLFCVEIYGSLDSRWGYNFISTRGISRRWWWVSE